MLKTQEVKNDVYEIDDIGKKIDCVLAANLCRWEKGHNDARWECIEEFLTFIMPYIMEDMDASKSKTFIIRKIQNSFETSRTAANRIYEIIADIKESMNAAGMKQLPRKFRKKQAAKKPQNKVAFGNNTKVTGRRKASAQKKRRAKA